MVEKTKRLPDAELAVMQIIWGTAELPVTAAAVRQQADRDWKMTSVLTFLSRLVEKGFLSCEKAGKQNLYMPLVSREMYLQRESARFVERLCGGSVRNLVASLSDAGALSEQDIDELRAFLDARADGEV